VIITRLKNEIKLSLVSPSLLITVSSPIHSCFADMPLTRTKSLQQFLQKRKER
jgi:hypothetical protein